MLKLLCLGCVLFKPSSCILVGLSCNWSSIMLFCLCTGLCLQQTVGVCPSVLMDGCLLPGAGSLGSGYPSGQLSSYPSGLSGQASGQYSPGPANLARERMASASQALAAGPTQVCLHGLERNHPSLVQEALSCSCQSFGIVSTAMHAGCAMTKSI